MAKNDPVIVIQNQILEKMDKRTKLMKGLYEIINKNILFHKETSKQIDDHKKLFQVMMDKSEFNHNKVF